MSRIQTILIKLHASILLFISILLLLLLLGSGHSINATDFAELKLLVEIILFALASISLFSKNSNFLFGKYFLVALLILTQLSFIDIFIESSTVSFEEASFLPVMFLILSLISVNNFYLIISRIKRFPKT